jgi:hypothetical protein
VAAGFPPGRATIGKKRGQEPIGSERQRGMRIGGYRLPMLSLGNSVRPRDH